MTSEPVAVGRGVRAARLDALRGCAALMVIGVHSNGLLSKPGLEASGPLTALRLNLDMGVELFFVLSGYLIALPFLRAVVSQRPLPSTAAYALRRAARILPAYWLALFFAMTIALQHPGAAPTGLALLPHIGLLHGLFPGETYRPLDLAWSLSAEAVFYVLVPLAALTLAARHRQWSIRSLAACVGVVWLSSATLAATTAAFAPNTSWTLVMVRGAPGVLCQFCPGILVALVQLSAERAPTGWVARLNSRRLFAAGFVGLLFSTIFTWNGPEGVGFVLRNQVGGLAFAGILLGTLLLRGSDGRVARRLAPLGTVSYGLYLWHWLADGMLISSGFRIDLPLPSAANWLLAWLVLALVTLPMARLSWRFIEAPAQRLAASRGRVSDRGPVEATKTPRGGHPQLPEPAL